MILPLWARPVLALEVDPDRSIRDVLNHLPHLQETSYTWSLMVLMIVLTCLDVS